MLTNWDNKLRSEILGAGGKIPNATFIKFLALKMMTYLLLVS